MVIAPVLPSYHTPDSEICDRAPAGQLIDELNPGDAFGVDGVRVRIIAPPRRARVMRVE
ncbi:MAG: hypothetical protein JXJ17_00610 [Anaerolineae bacterium]|nr:hypothetical protein [Anaerolineae bacterium]